MTVHRELRIVILEDVLTDLELILRSLTQAKIWYEFKHASTASAFEETLKTFSPDLILSDFNLPQFDGMTALRMAQRITPETPFIFVSGSIGEEQAVDALREGATDYVMKDRMQRLGTAVLRAMEDVTARAERHRADAALEDLARETKLILDSAGEGIIGIDATGNITLANPAAATMLGWPSEDLIGRSLHQISHSRYPDGTPFPWELCAVQRSLREGVPQRRNSDVFWRRDGSSFQVEFTSTPTGQKQDGSTCAVVIFRDIEERQLLERQLEQANRLNSLGRLAATIAHEFNNVLMGIQPFNDLIRKDTPSEKTNKATDQIAKSIQRGKRITGDILRFTRPALPAKQKIDVDEWIVSFATEMKGVVGDTIKLDVDVTVPGLKVLGDPHQLSQIFSNLVSNARDAMPKGGAITVRVLPPSARNAFPFGVIHDPETLVHFMVVDHGSGMTVEVVKKIFEPLFTTKRTGTGLGLAVCHQIVQQHGGQIFVESEIDKGTTFHVFLPLAD
jgi:two-component system cell cycle sensor histidine kinase/response regulator CckA